MHKIKSIVRFYKAVIAIAVALAFITPSSIVFANDEEQKLETLSSRQPPLPHAFWGTLHINGKLAPLGTRVHATGVGVIYPATNNPLYTSYAVGYYGGPGGFDPKLIVQGYITEGATISFYVNNVSTGQTHQWHSGQVTQFNLTVNIINDPPTITTTDVTIATEDEPYCVDYDAIDVNINDIITWGLNTNSGWLTLNETTGELSGTPTNNDVGVYWVNVSCSDGFDGTDFHNFTLTVNNKPPTILTSDILSTMEDVIYEVDYDSDDDGQGSVTWYVDTNASWLSIDPLTGILNGTPTNDNVGSYSVGINVSDGNSGYDEHYFTLTVVNTNDAPIIDTQDLLMVYEDEYYEVIYIATDIDVGDILKWTQSTNGTWLNWGPSNHTLYGTPRNDHVGEYWVKINITDGNEGYDEHNFNLSVLNVNDAPIITGAPTTLEVNAFENITLDLYKYINDVDNDLAELILHVDSKYAQVDGLSITFNYPNSVSSENVKITVSDGIDISIPHYILVTVIPKDIDAPTITEKTPTGTNVPVNANITITFSEPMLHLKVEGAFYIFPSVEGESSWVNNTMIFDPSTDLLHNTTYTVTLNTTATDLAGNPLEEPYDWNFTTEIESIGEIDTDGDGYPDIIDAFLDDPNEWIDTDGDEIGNNADPDDDNDGISDIDELAIGTDPLLEDTDEDGYDDGIDEYPLDSTKWKKEDEKPTKKDDKDSSWVVLIVIILVIIIVIILIFIFIVKYRISKKVKEEGGGKVKTEQKLSSSEPQEKLGEGGLGLPKPEISPQMPQVVPPQQQSPQKQSPMQVQSPLNSNIKIQPSAQQPTLKTIQPKIKN